MIGLSRGFAAASSVLNEVRGAGYERNMWRRIALVAPAHGRFVLAIEGCSKDWMNFDVEYRGSHVVMSRKTLKTSFAINLLSPLARIAVALVTVPIYIRHVGDARYGVISIMWVLLGYFGFLDLGLSRAATNALAKLLREGAATRARPSASHHLRSQFRAWRRRGRRPVYFRRIFCFSMLLFQSQTH